MARSGSGLTTITGALPWWNELPEDLDRCVRSLAQVADRIVALDGAYIRYPEATVTSDPAQADAIRKAARDVGLDCLILQPDRLWAGQVEKRSHLLAAATVGSDWIVTVDADHIITADREHTRFVLERVQEDVLEVPYRTPVNPERLMKDSAAGIWHIQQSESIQWIPHLWRALPGFRVEKRHWWYSAMKVGGRVWLWGGDGTYTNVTHSQMQNYEVEHRALFRTDHQVKLSRAFLNDREKIVATTGQEDWQPGMAPPVWDYKSMPL